MTAQIGIQRLRSALFALTLGLVFNAAPVTGQEPAPLSVPLPPAAAAPQIEHSDYWEARAALHHEQIRTARARLDEANEVVVRMRRRNHPRGEAREEIRAEQTRAQAAYNEAVRAFEVDLTSEAQAAGAQLRWLREPS